MIRCRVIFLFTFCFVLLTGDFPAASEYVQNKTENQKTDTFYDDSHRGWYWYEIEQEETDELPLNKEEEDPPAKANMDFTYEELWTMPPDRFKEYAANITKLAIQFPIEKNITRYLKTMDVTRRKSVAFASAVDFFGQKAPQYSVQDIYPIAAPGQKALLDERFKEIEDLIHDEKDHWALVMFTRQGCSFCHAQSSILAFFTRKFGWPVREIDIEQHPDAAARFGVEKAPALIIVSKDIDDYILLSMGVISMSELKQRIYRSIRYIRGDITPEQWSVYDFEKKSGADPLKFIHPDARLDRRGKAQAPFL